MTTAEAKKYDVTLRALLALESRFDGIAKECEKALGDDRASDFVYGQLEAYSRARRELGAVIRGQVVEREGKLIPGTIPGTDDSGADS